MGSAMGEATGNCDLLKMFLLSQIPLFSRYSSVLCHSFKSEAPCLGRSRLTFSTFSLSQENHAPLRVVLLNGFQRMSAMRLGMKKKAFLLHTSN